MYAAFSTTASLTFSLSTSLSSSEKACLLLRSTDSWICVRPSHVLSLSIVAFIEAGSDLPDASLSIEPMTVARPISCMARLDGIPVCARSSFSSDEKARHSGPSSAIFSFTTYPQLLQKSSPPAVSTTIGPLPQRGQRSEIRVGLRLELFFLSMLKSETSPETNNSKQTILRFFLISFFFFEGQQVVPASQRAHRMGKLPTRR